MIFTRLNSCCRACISWRPRRNGTYLSVHGQTSREGATRLTNGNLEIPPISLSYMFNYINIYIYIYIL